MVTKKFFDVEARLSDSSSVLKRDQQLQTGIVEDPSTFVRTRGEKQQVNMKIVRGDLR